MQYVGKSEKLNGHLAWGFLGSVWHALIQFAWHSAHELPPRQPPEHSVQAAEHAGMLVIENKKGISHPCPQHGVPIVPSTYCEMINERWSVTSANTTTVRTQLSNTLSETRFQSSRPSHRHDCQDENCTQQEWHGRVFVTEDNGLIQWPTSGVRTRVLIWTEPELIAENSKNGNSDLW